MSDSAQSAEWKPKASLVMITIAVMLATFVEVLNTYLLYLKIKKKQEKH